MAGRIVRRGLGTYNWATLKTFFRNLFVTIALLILMEDLYLVTVTFRKEDSCEIQELMTEERTLQELVDRRRDVKSLPSEEKVEPLREVVVKPQVPKERAKRDIRPNREAYLTLLGQVNDASLLTKLPDVPFDYQAIKRVRKGMVRETQVKRYLFAHKANTPLGSPLQFFEGRNKSTYFAVQEVFDLLPDADNKKLKFPRFLHKTCSVVGNGGILLDSGCGPSIDAANVVLRSNLPPLTLESAVGGAQDRPSPVDYYKDVGKKTSFVTFNPSGFSEYLRGLTRETYLLNFKEYMDQFGDAIAWTHMFHYESKARPTLQLIRISNALGFKSTVVSSHARFLQGVNDFWKKRGLTGQRATSGLVLTALAIALCKDTHLYGYWPFPVDYEGRQVPYHYYLYDSAHTQNNTFHKLPEEFQILQTLHKSGVIKLHIGKCEGN